MTLCSLPPSTPRVSAGFSPVLASVYRSFASWYPEQLLEQLRRRFDLIEVAARPGELARFAIKPPRALGRLPWHGIIVRQSGAVWPAGARCRALAWLAAMAGEIAESEVAR